MTSGVVWRNRDLGRMRSSFEARHALIKQRGEEIMQRITDEAAANMRRIIETSTTRTGDDRAAAQKGVAGRIDSGDMIGDVLASVEVSDDGTLITGSFGWLEEFENYYRYQEDGTQKIEAMHALLTSFIQARESLRAELKALSGEDLNR